MPAKFLLVVIAGVITVMTILLVAGHGPWAGHEIIRISANHGVNDGDVPVIAAGLLGLLCCWRLWRNL